MFSTLAHDAMTLHYQPMTDRLDTVVGFEALLRWHHRGRGRISPEAFIPIFERSGLIVPLTRWGLGRACQDAADWGAPLRVAVNLSPVQLAHEDVAALVEAALGDSGLPPERLEVEVRREALDADPDAARRTLRRLADEGVGIVFDRVDGDPLLPSRVRRFPVSRVKLDGALVSALDSSEAARSILGLIVELARSTGIAVIAAGVETEAARARVLAAGCDLLQGFRIGPPAPIEHYAAATRGNGAMSRRPRHDEAFDAGTERATRTAEHAQ